MLIQHILTKDIFLRVFDEDQFHRENNVARQLDALEHTFFTGDVRRQAIDRLRSYYGAIGRAADDIAGYGEKQQFIKGVYEDFYQAYNPGAADRLGVVYTPNEVVDFIIRGTDWLLQKHFGKTLGDRNVNILDPATGTGTFITNLISHLPVDRLEYKYLNEIYANEVEILPYYIANLNIEYTYKERMGRYLEFPNLCFVDTLDNMDWKGASGAAVPRQTALNLGGLSEENWIRVQEQNERSISVIMGNPPYNANQSDWNDFNPNRQYPEIDQRIRDTYVAMSGAHKTKQYDMYKRFVRWASDRLADDGIVGFVTNRAYLDGRQDDGFRRITADEFTDVYVLDLGSDVRRNPKISGTTHNIFGIQTGVAIAFFVRQKSKLGKCNIHYASRDDAELAIHKLAYLREANLGDIEFTGINPDKRHDWLNQSNSGFDTLMPVAKQKLGGGVDISQLQPLFDLYSMGVVTNRDGWVYDFDADLLGRKVRAFINAYEETRAVLGGTKFDDSELDTTIKWTPDLIRKLRFDIPNVYTRDQVILAMYRPFVSKYLYYSHDLNWSHYQLPQIFRDGAADENKVMVFCLNNQQFFVLAAGGVFDLHFTGDGWGLPVYRYTPDGERVSNITQWGLRQFREHYGDDTINGEDIFAYAYAMLHDPAYRRRYES